jgi:hypothetical protein
MQLNWLVKSKYLNLVIQVYNYGLSHAGVLLLRLEAAGQRRK